MQCGVGQLGISANVPLAQRTTIELGGRAKWFATLERETDVIEADAFARDKNVPLLVLGAGSNVLVPDAGIEGLVLHMGNRDLQHVPQDGQVQLTVGAGYVWDAFVAYAVEHGLAGIECLSGIPGTVGATPVQNVGAYGQEVADTITSVRVFDRELRTARELPTRLCGFRYRHSIFKDDPGRYVVLSVTFTLNITANKNTGERRVTYAELIRALGEAPVPLARIRDTVLSIRRDKSMTYEPERGDLNRRNVGSFFTNPIVPKSELERLLGAWAAKGKVPPSWPQDDGRVKLSAAWLIEAAGFHKGQRFGAFGISTAHALCLVHHGGGTTQELLRVADHIVQRVMQATGVLLVREPQLLSA